MIKNNRKIQETKTATAADINGKTNAAAVKTIPGPVFATIGSFEGEVYLQWDAIQNANHYAVEVLKNLPGKSAAWQQVDIISDPHYSMQGLKPGKSYSFRISAIFTEGQGPWSEAVTKKMK